MFAPQNQQPNVIDSMSGSMEDWYNAVDEAVKKSEVIPGNYEYTVATSYGNVGDIAEDSSTYFDVSCDRFKVVSLDNSFITIEQEITLTIPTQANYIFSTYYIGYKHAADCIDQYRIYSNTDLVQTQNHARYEWFMIYNSISDEAKENSDLYATINKVRNRNPLVPGVYVDLSKCTGGNIKINLKNRIPLSCFLTLFNLRFFPNWSGKLSIEIYPSYRNLVIAPVIPKDSALIESFSDKFYPLHTNDASCDISHLNLGFRNVNQTMLNVLKEGTPYVVTPQAFKCNGDGCKAYNCKIRLATYLLKMDIFNALAAKYIQVPLIFPIQTVQIKDFTQEILGKSGTFNTANTLALKHCDAMFIVFRDGEYARTCFDNPFIEFRLNVDGKFYPREENRTFNDERFLNNTMDALNINNSLLTSLSEDLRTSLQPFSEYRVAQADGGDLTQSTAIKTYWSLADYSNFLIGVPFCDSEDFMGGISTSGTIQVELNGTRMKPTANYILDTENATKYRATAICFEDALLKIRAVKPDGRSQIEITNAAIEQILAGAAI